MDTQNEKKIDGQEFKLSTSQQEILKRINWEGYEDCKDQVMNNSRLAKQLASGEITDFIGHAQYIKDESGRRIPVSTWCKGALSIIYAEKGPIRLYFHHQQNTPSLYIYGKNYYTKERFAKLTDRYPYHVKNEDGTPKLDANGKEITQYYYTNANLGDVIEIPNTKTGEQVGYLVSLDYPVYNKEGNQYRGTNAVVIKPVKMVLNQLSAMFEKGDYHGHKFSKNELELLAVGQSIVVEDFKNSKNEKYTGSVQYSVVSNSLRIITNDTMRQMKKANENISKYINNNMSQEQTAAKQNTAQEASNKKNSSTSKVKRR